MFAYRFAWGFGYPTPRHFMRDISARELAEIQSVGESHLIGLEREDFQLALIARMQAGKNADLLDYYPRRSFDPDAIDQYLNWKHQEHGQNQNIGVGDSDHR